VTFLVDTSVWSLALRRDSPPDLPEVGALRGALESGNLVVTTGLILQEILQGFSGPKAWDAIVDRLNALPFLTPDRRDHVEAAALRNRCRRKGIQVGTIDALLAALCIRYSLSILTTDEDFRRISQVAPLSVWSEG